jgi:putative acetyltransferase
VILLGDSVYYGRFGFEPAASYGIRPPVLEWEPYFQIRRLASWTPSLRGDFRYAPAFDDLG